MSTEDQSGFVRFAWGRSRLPPKSYWRVNMKLLRRNTSEDSLPVGQVTRYSCCLSCAPYRTGPLLMQQPSYGSKMSGYAY